MDCPFTSEEVSRRIVKLKKKKSPGPSRMMAEYLMNAYMRKGRILNMHNGVGSCTRSFEESCCSECLKGRGKDPLKADNDLQGSEVIVVRAC